MAETYAGSGAISMGGRAGSLQPAAPSSMADYAALIRPTNTDEIRYSHLPNERNDGGDMSGRTEEQRMMRQSCRDFIDDVVIPFIRRNWQREWDMKPEGRLPGEILEAADRIGIRTLGVPEEFGGVELDKASEVAS